MSTRVVAKRSPKFREATTCLERDALRQRSDGMIVAPIPATKAAQLSCPCTHLLTAEKNPWCSCSLILRRPAQPLIGERGTVSCPLDLRALLHGAQPRSQVPTFSQNHPGPRTPPRTSLTGLHQPFLLSAGRLQRSLTRILELS